MRLFLFLTTCMLCAAGRAHAQGHDTTTYTRADTLRGSNGPGRAWWDVAFYDLHVRVSPADSSIAGYDRITYRVLRPVQEMQIDLQAPLVLDSVVQDGRPLAARRDGNAYFLTLLARQREGETRTVAAYYHGQPGAGGRRRGAAASSGRPTVSAGRGSPPRTSCRAPASGGRTRTTWGTSPTASGSRSPSPTR